MFANRRNIKDLFAIIQTCKYLKNLVFVKYRGCLYFNFKTIKTIQKFFPNTKHLKIETDHDWLTNDQKQDLLKRLMTFNLQSLDMWTHHSLSYDCYSWSLLSHTIEYLRIDVHDISQLNLLSTIKSLRSLKIYCDSPIPENLIEQLLHEIPTLICFHVYSQNSPQLQNLNQKVFFHRYEDTLFNSYNFHCNCEK